MSSTAAVWTVVIGLGLASAMIRYSFLGLLNNVEIPARIKTALSFVPVTILPALAAPMIAFDPGGGEWAEPHRMLAALAAVAIGVVTRSMLAGVLTGMAAFVTLRAVGL